LTQAAGEAPQREIETLESPTPEAVEIKPESSNSTGMQYAQPPDAPVTEVASGSGENSLSDVGGYGQMNMSQTQGYKNFLH
jgi:hypothetical protein